MINVRKIVLLVSLVLILSSYPTTGNQSLFSLRIICPKEYAFRADYARIIADEFIAVGIDVSLEYMSFDEVMKRCFDTNGKLYKQGGFDVALFAWQIGGDMDAENIYYTFHSDSSVRIKTGTSDVGNCMSWENSENDALIENIQEEKDEIKKEEYWLKWQELFYEEQPLAPIYSYYREIEGKKSWLYQHVAFNMNHPALKKKLVRQALSHLIPRQKICNLHNSDKKNEMSYTITPAEPCAVPVNPDFFAFNSNLKPYSYDQDLARELLFKAGYNVKTRKHLDAEALLQQAEEAFKAFEFQKALDLANQAKALYEELGETTSVTTVDATLSLYQKALEGETLLNEGKQLQEQGEYETARQTLSEAKQKFSECGLTAKVSEIDSILSEMDEALRKKSILQEADSLFEQGKGEFSKENYETALNLFTQAKEKYVSVGSEKAAECDEWIKKTEEEMKKPCLGTVILAVFVGACLFVLQRRSS